MAKIATTYAAHLWILIHNFPVASYRLTGKIVELCMITQDLEIGTMIVTSANSIIHRGLSLIVVVVDCLFGYSLPRGASISSTDRM